MILPGETINLPVPLNFLTDREVSVEPRDNIEWVNPEIVQTKDGLVTISNGSDNPVKLKRHQVIGQIRSVVMPTEHSAKDMAVTDRHFDNTGLMTHITINPDHILTTKEARSFEIINTRYKSVFTSLHGTYNGKSGNIQASVILGKNLPTPKKGKVPSYNSDKAKILKEKFDELVLQGVLSRPEDNDITVIHTSPSFLVKKAGNSYGLVTYFVELNKYICPLPTCCVAAVLLLCCCCVAAVLLLCCCCVAAVLLLCCCCVAAVLLLCCCCVAAVLLLCCCCVAAVLLLCCCCVAAVLLLCCCCVAAVLLLCCCCVAAVLLLCCCCVAAVLLLCCCCVAAVLLLCCCCVAAVLLLCCCCVAAVLLLCCCCAAAALLLCCCCVAAVLLLCC